MEDRLRECPRCRSEQTSLHDYHGEVAPICWKCKLSGPYFQTPGEAAEWWNTRATDLHKDHRCRCDMRTSLVGDGCRYCNPQYYIDMLEEQVKESSTDQNTSELMLIAHMDAYAEAKKKYEPLMEKMAEALKKAKQHLPTGYWWDGEWVQGQIPYYIKALNKEIDETLQEYRERVDAK